MPRGQNVSRLLATSFKILVANTQSLVTLATSESQFRTLFSLFSVIMTFCDKEELNNLNWCSSETFLTSTDLIRVTEILFICFLGFPISKFMLEVVKNHLQSLHLDINVLAG